MRKIEWLPCSLSAGMGKGLEWFLNFLHLFHHIRACFKIDSKDLILFDNQLFLQKIERASIQLNGWTGSCGNCGRICGRLFQYFPYCLPSPLVELNEMYMKA